MQSRRLSRRRAVQIGAAATALPLVHIRTAGAAGKLNVGFWDHWVPNGTEAMRKQVMAWADKNKVEVTARLHHLAGQQAAADRRRRGAVKDRS